MALALHSFPRIKKIYDQFNEKGFEIIGYSLDIHGKNLEDFLLKQKLKWNNISDLRGDQSAVYKLFKLGTIPSNFLIDRNGIIIGANLTPEDILKILEKKFELNN